MGGRLENPCPIRGYTSILIEKTRWLIISNSREVIRYEAGFFAGGSFHGDLLTHLTPPPHHKDAQLPLLPPAHSRGFFNKISCTRIHFRGFSHLMGK